MADIALRNMTDREFTDISSEAWREYILTDGTCLEITNPQWLHISDSGHYVVDSINRVYFVPHASIFTMQWQVKSGHPHFGK